ncbi:MAG: thioredoxin domain-containing protein [Acidobacteriota bacterium]
METRTRIRPDGRVSPTDRVRGSPLARVTLIGYGDFANPDCSDTYRTVQAIEKKLGSRLRYVFRCFPEAAKFAGAERAAEAAEAAGSQGRFWEMHDRLFESVGGDDARLEKHAQDLDLDVDRFLREMRAHVHLARIRARRSAAVRRGVCRTPAFFINAIRYESSFGLTTLLPAVQAAAGELQRGERRDSSGAVAARRLERRRISRQERPSPPY